MRRLFCAAAAALVFLASSSVPASAQGVFYGPSGGRVVVGRGGATLTVPTTYGRQSVVLSYGRGGVAVRVPFAPQRGFPAVRIPYGRIPGIRIR